jgi:hypothetical protein
VSNDVKALKKEWCEEAKEDISLLISRELAELDRMELESAGQYQAAKKAGKDNIALRYADHRLDIKDRRAKLLGLDKPIKIESKNEIINVEATDEIRSEILSRLYPGSSRSEEESGKST